jgi:hypothetical protein
MKKTDAAWAAGIVDGEGCIVINRSAPNGTQRTRTYRLVIKVTMGHKPTIERLHTLFGIGSMQNHQPKSERMNASHSWICQARQSATVLKTIRPYLVTKADEADLAFKFLALPAIIRGGAHGQIKMPLHMEQERDRLYWAMRQAKSRWRFYLEKTK